MADEAEPTAGVWLCLLGGCWPVGRAGPCWRKAEKKEERKKGR